jgi:hypothetical protein
MNAALRNMGIASRFAEDAHGVLRGAAQEDAGVVDDASSVENGEAQQ